MADESCRIYRIPVDAVEEAVKDRKLAELAAEGWQVPGFFLEAEGDRQYLTLLLLPPSRLERRMRAPVEALDKLRAYGLTAGLALLIGLAAGALVAAWAF